MTRKRKSAQRGRKPKLGASRHTIRVTDEVWLAYEDFGNNDATRGIERAAVWLKQIEEWEGRAHEILARRTDEE